MTLAKSYGDAMRVFLIGCVLGFVWGLINNTVWRTFHGPIYPLLDVAVWSLAGGWIAVFLGLVDWLMRKTAYQSGSKPS